MLSGLLDAEVNAEQTDQHATPAGADGSLAVIIIDPDAPVARKPFGGRVGTVSQPHFASVVTVVETTDLGRVSHVSDESDVMGLGNSEVDQAAADQAAEIEAAMAEARARLADVPAEVVVTNHVMGLYELAAIHLSAETPDLVSASLAIDAMSMLVDGLGDRLGDDAPTMKDALGNIKMAFVGVKAQSGQADPSDD